MHMEESDSLEFKKLKDELELVKNRLIRLESSLENLNVQKVQIKESEKVDNYEDFEIKLPFSSQDSIEFLGLSVTLIIIESKNY